MRLPGISLGSLPALRLEPSFCEKSWRSITVCGKHAQGTTSAGNEDVLLAIRIEHALSRKADLERLAMLIYVGAIIVFGGAYVFLRLTTPSEVIHNHPQLHRWIGEDGIAKRIWNSLSHRMAEEL
ncbi:hypothetical protein CYMTET_9175 [Cymbomonas tetramitiformis]|uniref:Uncharacterized protein n=1 Tax=Cymbomonas tetramitiformis TaxID=36881 RepID=A0AAE0LFA8_9CHLO|nr:hypothetical protein CYMTET_9175 [Cymbomonas tetramitiformis]